jgi:hypothetical protein
MDTLPPNVAAEAPETQQLSLYYLLSPLSPVEALSHVHRQRHIQHRCAQGERHTTPLPPAAHVQFRGLVTTNLSGSGSSGEAVESSRASPPHRSREDRLTHPADTSRSNLAAALALLSRWRVSKPQQPTRLEIHENPDSAHPGTPDHAPFPLLYTSVRTAAHSLWSGGSPGLTVSRHAGKSSWPGWATAPTRCIMSYGRQCPSCYRVAGQVVY